MKANSDQPKFAQVLQKYPEQPKAYWQNIATYANYAMVENICMEPGRVARWPE